MTDCRIIAVRRIGKRSLRCEDDKGAELGKMKVQNWSKMAKE